MADLRFRHPTNGYVRTHTIPWLWLLLIGPFYFAVLGAWKHVAIWLAAGLFTCGLGPWLVYPFFARAALRDHYLSRGWVES